jgi:hypothetical protein
MNCTCQKGDTTVTNNQTAAGTPPTARQAQARVGRLTRQLQELDERLAELREKRKGMRAELAEARRQLRAVRGRTKGAAARPGGNPAGVGKNSIFVIRPYKWSGLWVFDDPQRGLDKEPFVGGADTMIDVATRSIPDAEQGFVAVFSAGPFPDAQIVLEWVREEGGGNVYRWPEQGMEGWLCPALLKYFQKPPRQLFLQIKRAGNCRAVPGAPCARHPEERATSEAPTLTRSGRFLNADHKRKEHLYG